MLAAAAVAACIGWHGTVAGAYQGTVDSEGPKPIDTQIIDTPQGLGGRYVLHEPTREVDGTLEPLGDQGCDVALFRWTDLYGTGIARLSFDPARHCFVGTWGRQRLNAALTWRSCAQAPVTS